MLYIRYQYIFSHVLGIDLNENNNIINMKWYDYIFLNLYYMMNIKFKVKGNGEFYHFKYYMIWEAYQILPIAHWLVKV